MPDVRPATPLTKPRMGLLAAAAVVESTAGPRWGLGLTWYPELVPDGTDAFGARALKCVTGALTRTGVPVVEEAYPFMVFARDSCGSFDDGLIDPRDRQGRARRLLEATRSFSVAKEFWSGAISTAEGLANTWLKKPTATATTSGAMVPNKALAKLDNAIAVNLSNGRGMIHCTVEVLDRLNDTRAIRREGTLWLTPFDNVVVADGGYDGTGAAAGTWMFATTPVEIKFGPVSVTDPESMESFDRATNDIHVWAQQDVIVQHEPHLLWHSAQVDLT